MATFDFDQGTIRSGPNGELLTTGIYANPGAYFPYRTFAMLAGGGGNDTLVGGASISVNNTPNGWGGNPVILNYTGNDEMSGGGGDDLVSGNQGNDGLGGGTGNDTLNGGTGNDSLAGDQDNDLLYGDEGDDFLRGGPGNDVYYGGDGNDVLQDDAYLGSGADAGPNNDTMYGGDGNDTLNGYTGADAMYGDAGDDVLYVGAGDTTIDGGTGNDTAVASVDITSATFLNVENLRIASADYSTVTLTAAQYNSFTTVGVLRGPQGDLRSATFVLSGGGSVGANFLSSEMAPSFFVGSNQADTIDFSTSTVAWGVDAGDGADRVLGGVGNDGLTGGSGNDTITGGAGNDTISAGAGDDTVIWRSGDGNDTVTLGLGNNTIDLQGWGGGAAANGVASGDWTPTINGASATFTRSGGTVTVTDWNAASTTVICFYPGTMIATPEGERAVETLAIGDLVLTNEGDARPVRWMGRQTVSTRFADPLRVLPIRIQAGALAKNVPSRDLLVSPDHAILVEGLLVHAGALVNGTTIAREARVPERFTYHHVELADHSLIMAENTPAETFVDNTDRLAFDNWDEHEALFGQLPGIVEMTRPRAKSHRQVPRALREYLALRASGAGTSLGPQERRAG